MCLELRHRVGFVHPSNPSPTDCKAQSPLPLTGCPGTTGSNSPTFLKNHRPTFPLVLPKSGQQRCSPKGSSAGPGWLGVGFVILSPSLAPQPPVSCLWLRVIFHNYNVMGDWFPQDVLGSWINDGEYSYLEIRLFLREPAAFFVLPST